MISIDIKIPKDINFIIFYNCMIQGCDPTNSVYTLFHIFYICHIEATGYTLQHVLVYIVCQPAGYNEILYVLLSRLDHDTSTIVKKSDYNKYVA